MELVPKNFVHWHHSKTRYPFRIAQFFDGFAFANPVENRVRPYVGLVKAPSIASRPKRCQKILKDS
jgi:hypothetical protein